MPTAHLPSLLHTTTIPLPRVSTACTTDASHTIPSSLPTASTRTGATPPSHCPCTGTLEFPHSATPTSFHTTGSSHLPLTALNASPTHPLFLCRPTRTVPSLDRSPRTDPSSPSPPTISHSILLLLRQSYSFSIFLLSIIGVKINTQQTREGLWATHSRLLRKRKLSRESHHIRGVTALQSSLSQSPRGR